MGRAVLHAFAPTVSLLVLLSIPSTAAPTFRAHLLSDKHAPPRSQAKAEMWVDGEVLRFRIFFRHATNYSTSVIQEGDNGPTIAIVHAGGRCEPDAPQPLADPGLAEKNYKQLWEGSIPEDWLSGGLEGGTIADLVDAMESRDCYILISTCDGNYLLGRIK